MKEITVHHDAGRKGFFSPVDGMEAELTYREEDDGTLAYHHTYVPVPFRRRGIAGAVTRYALQWARREGKKVRPVCPYVVEYVRRNPEFGDITV